jgi:predicted metal-dependent hydrolase
VTFRWRKKRQSVKRALLSIDGRAVTITLKANPRARRYIVKVHPSTGEVSVVAPDSRSLERALDFAREERDWIAQRLAHVPKPVPLARGKKLMFRGQEHLIRFGARRKRPVWIDYQAHRPTIRASGTPDEAPRALRDWLKREARRRIEERVAEYARVLGVKPKRVILRDTSSRWGACTSARNLSFSWRLVLAPAFVLDYVLAHEVAHLREMNHAPRFWRLVEYLVDNIERPQRWLSKNGALLHRYASKRGV